MKRATLALVPIALALAGCGGSGNGDASPSDDPGEFTEDLYRQYLLGQHGRIWDTLHPAHQEVVSRSLFEECSSRELEDFRGVELVDVEILETYEDPIDVEGIPEKTSTAVTYRATVRFGEEEASATDTGHLVTIDGGWRWILEPDDVRAYEDGTCPADQS